MSIRWKITVFPACIALLIAGDQAWRDKKVSDWTEEDAKEVLSDSPWIKTVTPSIERPAAVARRGGMGRGGVGMGIPGVGRRGGMGGGYPTNRSGSAASKPPTLTLRWESALPIRSAELKAQETNAPTVDEGHYGIAVYGVPNRVVNGRQQISAKELKKQAVLKREGKKDLKPSEVEILQREDGPVILYSFPRSTEITPSDATVDFQVQIGILKLKQSFVPGDMIFQGHIEL